jgi:hypothetical protein
MSVTTPAKGSYPFRSHRTVEQMWELQDRPRQQSQKAAA